MNTINMDLYNSINSPWACMLNLYLCNIKFKSSCEATTN